MYYPRMMVMGWRKIHNTSISTFLIYLNWWSAFVAGGLSFIPMLPNGCQPQTEFPFMSSWIELFTFVILVLQSALLSVLFNKLDNDELVDIADKIVLIYHGISLIMPVTFLFLTNMMTEWTIEASKLILQYHFAQNLANIYNNHVTTMKPVQPLGVWVATSGLCQYGSRLCTRSKHTKRPIGYRSCYTNYYFISTQIFVALSIMTPFVMKLLEVIVSPGIREPIMMQRPIRPPRSKSRGWPKWLLVSRGTEKPHPPRTTTNTKDDRFVTTLMTSKLQHLHPLADY